MASSIFLLWFRIGHWPQFRATLGMGLQSLVWFGDLKGLERSFHISVEYGLPRPGDTAMSRFMPDVRVLRPSLVLNFDAIEEAPIPHVYFEGPDIRQSPLSLFDPEAGEWDRTMLIADTTTPWAARWFAGYEVWEATGRWVGGGRHADGAEQANAARRLLRPYSPPSFRWNQTDTPASSAVAGGKPFKILSIVGDGILGLLPCLMLAEIESRFLDGEPIGRTST